MRRRCVVIFLLVLLSWLPARAAQTELKHFDRDLEAQGVSEVYSDAALTALVELVRKDIGDLKTQASAEHGKDRNRLEQMAEAVSGALDRFVKIAGSGDEAAKSAAFPALKSMLYSLRSERQGERKGGILGEALGVLGNLSLKLPYLSSEERKRPLTQSEAKLEAANLVDPASGKVYKDPSDLAGLTSEQVSRLEVRDDNYLWYTDAELKSLKSRYGTAWKALETGTESRIAVDLKSPYSLDRARRVLVFEKIKKSDTSPKIEVKDLYGRDWKIKWGEEVQTEAFANRLYAELGGKFADLVYVNQGPRDLVLVLKKQGDGGADDHCDEIETLDQLKRCLLGSRYHFDISAHVAGHGVITEEMLEAEPFASLPIEKKKLLGRDFVTFNESQVELEPDAADFQGLGAGPLASSGALQDRVKRGLAILSYWIQNKDVKEYNNRGVIDRRSGMYLEYMQDMGASLGNMKYSGNPNLLKIGDDYVRRSGSKVKFTANMLYAPRVFNEATYADAVWMTRKIVNLTLEEVLAALTSTQWPDFQQQVVASRLIARRNDLARVFDVGPPISYDAAPETIALSTPADRKTVVARYRLAIATQGNEQEAQGLLEQFMRRCGIDIDEDGQASFEDKVDRTVPPRDGKHEEPVLETQDCEKSVIVALLEQTVHPSGLARRMWRRHDDKPLKACQPTAKTLGLPDQEDLASGHR